MSVGTLGVSRAVVRWCAVGVAVAGCAAALLVGVSTVQRASAQSTAVDLAEVAHFAVLTSGTVSGAGTSSITGDVGGSTVTGLDGRVTGAVTTGGGTAQSLADLGTADDAVASSAVTAALTEVGGTLRPGTYGVSGAIDVPGGLTLDAGGNPDATFIIKTDAAFTTGAQTSITLAGGARACNVFWLSGGSATIDGGSVVGTVFGRSGITARSGASVTGRLLARSGAVRLDGATVHVPTDCKGAPTPDGTGTGGTGTGTVPATSGPAEDRAGDGASHAGGSRSSSNTEEGTGSSTAGGTGSTTERHTGSDPDGGAARGGGHVGSSRGGATDSGARTGDDRGSAGSRAGAGGGTPTDGRTSDATGGRTPAPRDADSRAGRDEDRPGGAPVVTVPKLGPDGDEPGLGRRVLGVLAHLPRPDRDASSGIV